jgi:hypothetical protein
MKLMRDLLEHFRHGAGSEEREVRIARAAEHERTIARADQLLELGNRRVAVRQSFREVDRRLSR